MDYTALKHAHAGFAYLSIMLFVVRFALYQWRPALQQIKLLNIMPHIINTGLLAAAVGLAMTLQQYPLTDAWLTAKLIALLFYVGLGIVAIKRGNWMAACLTVVVFVYIIGVAKFHSAASWAAQMVA